MSPADLALAAFTLCNSIRVFAYLPQIMLICRDTGGAAAISYATWGMFAASHLSTVAYAAIAVQDRKMALVFLANTLCCATILALTFYKRLHHNRLPAGQVVVGAKPSSSAAAQATGLRKRNRPRGFKPIVINNSAYSRLQPSVPLLDEWRLSQRSS